MIDGPIPGESLTKEPKGYNWERPPEIVDPEEAILMHITRLQDEDRMNTVLDALEFGMVDLYTLTKGLMRSAVANGIHSIDVGLIAAPVVHEFIKQTADSVGVKFDDGINQEKQREKDKHNREVMRARQKLDEMDLTPDEDFQRDSSESDTEAELEAPEVEMDMEPETTEMPTKKGLMARGGGK